jgi:hypothetical protein
MLARMLLGQALRRLARRPVRSFLLLQGTIWGVAVAVFPSAVIEGTSQAARREAAVIGADRISLAADPTSAERVALQAGDVEVARRAVEAAGVVVRHAAGLRVRREWEVEAWKGRAGQPRAAWVAGPPEGPLSRGHALAEGRWLRAGDAPEACVVEAGVSDWLGRPALRPGDVLALPGEDVRLTVVGVLAPRPALALATDDLGFRLDHAMYARFAQGFLMMMGLPVVRDGWKRSDACVWSLCAPDEGVDWIALRVAPDDLSRAAALAREALAREQRTAVTLYPIVLPMLLSGQVERFDAVRAAMFLACLAMGAVVMANLGLLNVLTRGREIAIRRVEGASRLSIAAQFLLEGLLLALGGSALGLVLAMGLAALRAALEPVAGFDWVVPWGEAALAVGVALLVGLLATLLPALKAAAQDPVEGLAGE